MQDVKDLIELILKLWYDRSILILNKNECLKMKSAGMTTFLLASRFKIPAMKQALGSMPALVLI